MKITAEHPKAIGKRAGISVEERLLLDRITLHRGGISPGNEEFATAIEAHLAHSGLSFGNGTAMSARKAANAIVAEILDETGFGLADSPVEDVAQGGH